MTDNKFRNYLEAKGFKVKESGRIDICPVCDKKESASIKGGAIKCFNTSCKLDNRGMVPFLDYIKEFGEDNIGIIEGTPELEKKAVVPKSITVDVEKNHKIYSEVVEYFQEVLFERKNDLNYLIEKRGRTEESIRHFKVGFVSDTNRLYNRLKNRYSIDEIEASGLYKDTEFGMEWNSHFNVYTYPIWWKGKIRTIKFKNDVMNEYIQKKFTGDHCSFLNSAALKEDEFILVEGENDCMRLWELGKKNTVAILGSLGTDQLAFLKKLRGNKTISLCFDNDDAGNEYDLKIVNALRKKHSMILKTISYSGADPDVGYNFDWNGHGVEEAVEELGEIEKAQLNAGAQFFTDRYVKVEVGSTIIYANKKYRTQWLGAYDMMQKHGDKKKRLQNWMKYHAPLAERGVCCDYSTTAHIVNDRFNLFGGFEIKPIKGPLPEKWLAFVKKIICNGSDEYYEYILDWLSDLFQNPNLQTSIVPVITSRQGAGKNLFEYVIQKIIGKNYSTRLDSFESITGTYNGILENKLFINLDEATFGKSKKETNRLKSLTGNSTVSINAKYKPAYEVDFSCRFIITSNDFAPVGVESGNRRFFVLQANNSKIGDKKYYDDIWNDIDDTKLSALYYFLCERKISADYYRTHVKSTIYEKAMMDETLDSVGTWLNEVENGFASEMEDWDIDKMEGKVKLCDMHARYSTWYENNKDSLKYNEKFTKARFSRLLQTIYWKDHEYSTFKFGQKAAKGFRLLYKSDTPDDFEKELMKDLAEDAPELGETSSKVDKLCDKPDNSEKELMKGLEKDAPELEEASSKVDKLCDKPDDVEDDLDDYEKELIKEIAGDAPELGETTSKVDKICDKHDALDPDDFEKELMKYIEEDESED